jgi:hypothetical protein
MAVTVVVISTTRITTSLARLLAAEVALLYLPLFQSPFVTTAHLAAAVAAAVAGELRTLVPAAAQDDVLAAAAVVVAGQAQRKTPAAAAAAQVLVLALVLAVVGPERFPQTAAVELVRITHSTMGTALSTNVLALEDLVVDGVLLAAAAAIHRTLIKRVVARAQEAAAALP